MASLHKAYRRPGLPLSTALLAFAFFLYGALVSLLDYVAVARLFGFWTEAESPVTEVTFIRRFFTFFPIGLALLGVGILFKSVVARELTIGLSLVEVAFGGVLGVVVFFAPESLSVIFPSAHVSNGTVYLFADSVWPAAAVALVLIAVGILQLRVLNANSTRRAFNLAH